MSILLYLANMTNTSLVPITVPVAYHMFNISPLTYMYFYACLCVCASVWVYTRMYRFAGGEVDSQSFSITVFPCAGTRAVCCLVQPFCVGAGSRVQIFMLLSQALDSRSCSLSRR